MFEFNIKYRILDSGERSIQLQGHRDYPFYYYGENQTCWVLADEIHNFLAENNIRYSFTYRDEEGWFIIFEKPSDAVFFKLSWNEI